MVEAGSIWIRLKLDSEELRFGLDKARYGLTQWRDETNQSSMEMAKWGAAVGAVVVPVAAAGAAAYAAVEKYGAMAAEIGDLAYTTGMSTEKIQQLQYAATLSNTAFSSVTMGVNTLTLAIAKAGDTSSDAGKAFAALNVSTAGKSPDQVFEDTTTALVGMKDETRRNEIAMTLYGRSWKEMLPFMEDYLKNKGKIQSSPTFNKEELQDLKDAKAAWDGLNRSITIYSGEAIAFVEKSFSSDSIDSVMTLDRAYRKLFTGDIKGYLDEAAKYHDNLVAIEQKKLTDLLKGNSAASTPGATGPATPIADPFAGLTSHDAEIKNMTDFTIPTLTQNLKDLQASGTASYSDIADASLKLIQAKEKLIELSTKETDTQNNVTDATKSYTDAIQGLQDLKKNEARELSIINPRDVSAFRTANIRNQWAEQDQVGKIGAAQSALVAAGGKPAGDLIINIDSKQLAKVSGVIAGDLTPDKLTARGVRIA